MSHWYRFMRDRSDVERNVLVNEAIKAVFLQETPPQIQDRLARHLKDPTTVAKITASLREVSEGHVLPWRIAMLPLPRWVFSILFAIAPYLWGREYRKLVVKK